MGEHKYVLREKNLRNQEYLILSLCMQTVRFPPCACLLVSVSFPPLMLMHDQIQIDVSLMQFPFLRILIKQNIDFSLCLVTGFISNCK